MELSFSCQPMARKPSLHRSFTVLLLFLTQHITAFNLEPFGLATDHLHYARQVSQPLKECLSLTKTQILYPDSGTPSFNTTAKSQNTNYDYEPSAIALPKSTEEVQSVVRCVVQQGGGTRISTFGGGHGYASYALGGADGFVVVDSRDMQDIQVDKNKKTVRVGMGMRIGPLSKRIGQDGFALPHGTCSSVGVVGHVLGGGWGFSSRPWGWMLDHLVGITYVDAKGEIKEIGTSGEEIWWGMRGAGANNFGVVTDVTFEMVDAPKTSLNWKTTLKKNVECGAALLAIQDLGQKLAALPKELGVQLLMYGEGTNNKGACSISGQYMGPVDEFRQLEIILADRVQYYGGNYTNEFNVTVFDNWVSTLENLQGTLTAPPNAVPYYAQSIVDDGAPNYTNASIQPILKAIQGTVNVSEGVTTSLSFDLNGPTSATNLRQPRGPSAFSDAGKRNALFLSQIYVYGMPGFDKPEEQQKVYKVVDAVQAAVRQTKPDGKWSSYVNYVDPRLKNWGEEYYGDALGRLKELKAQVDPDNVFDYPQGLAHA